MPRTGASAILARPPAAPLPFPAPPRHCAAVPAFPANPRAAPLRRHFAVRRRLVAFAGILLSLATLRAADPDLAAIQAAVASAREKLGDRAGVPEVPDRFIAIPREAAWLTPAEARRAFAPALPRLEKLRWWRIGLDPTKLTHALREPAAVVAGLAAAHRAGLDGADRALPIARAAADFLLWAQASAGTGVFPFPAVRGHTDDPAFAAADRFLAGAERAGKRADHVRAGWAFDDGADGGLQFDNAECGNALLDLHAAVPDTRWLEAARRAGDWAVARPVARNWNYNSFSVHLLARLAVVTGERRYLDAALAKARLGVLPGQLTSGPRAGRWVDPHNARPAYHYIMLGALAELAGALPAADPARPEIVRALALGLRARNADFAGPGAANKDKAMEALLIVHRVFAADAAFLRETQSDVALEALGRLVSDQARRGQAPLGPRGWGQFLAYAAARPPAR